MNNQSPAMAIAVRRAVNKVYREIMDYESDTFSASGSQLTPQEATKIIKVLITTRMSIGDNVDGVSLSTILSELRGH